MNLKNSIQLIGIDLDGTLLSSNKSISETDLETLYELGKRNIVRVAATGRSLHKVREVLPINTPFDYVVFSSGGGIYDWQNQLLLQSEDFSSETLVQICNLLLSTDLNFIVFQSIPNNNKFEYHRGATICTEFEDYLQRHIGFFKPLSTEQLPVNSGHILVTLPNTHDRFELVKSQIENCCSGIKIIRSTSPVNDEYLWLEIFPSSVSKGHGLKWLCDKLEINYLNTMGIGNDYNDLDMFEFVAQPYVLGNGIEQLKQKYQTVEATNNESGVSIAIWNLIE